jgi:Bacterial protein of unknown function (DUF922)
LQRTYPIEWAYEPKIQNEVVDFMALTIVEPDAISGLSHRLTALTLADLAREITRVGAGIGAAKWNFGTYSWRQGQGGRLDVDLTMTLTILMPVWMNVTNRPGNEKREWRRWHAALRYHEDGHHAICRREAQVMYDRMRAATPSTIGVVFAREKQRIQALNNAYDVQTGHGSTQQTPHGTTVMQVPPP